MRRLTLAALFLALGMALSGCQETGEVENQAYVLVLAMDGTGDGALALTARVPKIGKSAVKDNKGESDGSPYLTFSVSAPSWSQALDALQWATPRRINLSHIEMIVVSEALAAQPSFAALMRAVANTPHLYTNARFVVCRGRAQAFLEAGETVIGTRLSSEIRAMLSQYTHQGFIPDACLADAYYCANGIYGDAIAISGYVEGENGQDDAFTVAESPMKQRFYGTALFAQGRLVGTLSPAETRLFNLICGQMDALPYLWQSTEIELVPESASRRRVLFDGDNIILSPSLRLSAPDGFSEAETIALEAAVRGDIRRLIEACQRQGCDPFGFAEAAARHFSSVPEWLAFDWRAHYRNAGLNIEVSIQPSHPDP